MLAVQGWVPAPLRLSPQCSLRQTLLSRWSIFCTFWAPVSRAHRNGNSVSISAKKSWVTSAGHAQSYVVSSLAPEGMGPTDSTLYVLPAQTRGLSVVAPWDGLGLRANASAPIALENCQVPPHFQLTDDGAGFQAMLDVVLPRLNLGSAAVAVGSCRGAVAVPVW